MPRNKQQAEALRSATREKIRAAGLQLFAYKGLAATSIQDIASLAGISAGLMYHYYPSKEALFTELVESAVNAASQATTLIFGSDQSPAEKIKTFSRDVVEEISQRQWMSQLYLLMIHYTLVVENSDKTSVIKEQGLAPLESVMQTICEGQAQGVVKPGEPAEMALVYFAAIQGLAIYKLTMGDRFAAPSPDLLNGLLLRGP